MSHKMKVSYQLDIADEKAKPAVENLLKSLMDWVRIHESEWIVLSNRHTAESLREQIKKLLKSKDSKVLIQDIKKTKIMNDEYKDAKNGKASEVLFTSRY